MLGDDPPYLSVGTEVSAKYKGAFCEAKIRKVVRSVKCRVTYKQGLGTATVTDDQIKGTLRVGASVEARHVDKKDFVEATITKIQDCSQYTVVFDDGDITTLRRTALCLKSGRHFAESETLDQLPLTHPEHFGNPVIGGRRGRRSRQAQDDSSEDEESPPRGSPSATGSLSKGLETEPEIGRVVCVELGDKKKKDNWFPGLVVAPTAQDTVRIRVRDDYLVRSFKDARYYTVPKKEATEFTKEIASKVDNSTLKLAFEKALLFLEKNELPPHWDRDSLFGNSLSSPSDSSADLDSDSSDDEPREEKDHFVAQLYKFMDDRGTPINNCPMIGTEDIDLYRLFRAVYKLGGYNRVTNQNQWKSITRRLGLSTPATPSTHNSVKQAYKKFLHSFEDFYRKLGCTMVNHPRGATRKQRPGRSLIRDKDRNTPVPILKMEKGDKDKDSEEGSMEVKKPEEKILVVSPVEDDPKIKKKEPIEEMSGAESDVNIEESTAESSSSEKSQKPLTPVPSRSKIPPKVKEELKKKSEKKKIESSASSTSSGSSSIAPKKDKLKEEEITKTRSKSKEDPKPKEEKPKDSRDTRETSREAEKPRNPKQRRLTEEDLKKRGRKKREEQEKTREKDENSGTESAPSYKGPIQLGDRLKVYYGPTHESKVTYEAKVIGIQRIEEGAELDYLVHYTGWNTRYDEWIKATRIAQNFTQSQGRVKRTKAPRPQTPLTKGSKNPGRRRAASVAPSGTKSSGSSSSGKEKEARSTTPLSIASSSSRTKSPATPASRPTRNATRNQDLGVELRTRRTRRVSGHTDLSVASESESDGYETDNTEPERARTRSRGGEERRRREVRRRVEDRMRHENSEVEDEKTSEELPRRTRRLRKSVKKPPDEILFEETDEPEENEDDDDDNEPEPEKITEEIPKGRDFDLNEIRSELKGFDKAVKVEVLRVEPEGSGDDEQKLDQPEKSDKPEVTDKTEKSDKQNSEKPEKPIKIEESEKIEKPEKSEKGEKPEKLDRPIKIEKPDIPEEILEINEDVPVKIEIEEVVKPISPTTEDIYEFKEPEPFEFEVRNKRDSGEKDKPSLKKRVFDEEPKSPKKKQKIGAIAKDVKQETGASPISVELEAKKKPKRSIIKRADEIESEAITVSKTPELEKPEKNLTQIVGPAAGPYIPEIQKIPTEALFSEIDSQEIGSPIDDDVEDRLVILETDLPEVEEKPQSNVLPSFAPDLEVEQNLIKKEESVGKDREKETASIVASTSVSSTIVISTNLSATSAVERRIMEAKITSVPVSVIPVVPVAPTVPVPISARLPATSTIEEKLSLAFRQQKPKDEEAPKRKEVKKPEAKRKGETESKGREGKIEEEKIEKIEKVEKIEKMPKRQIDPLKEISESAELEKQKRKKIVSQEFVDSTDSSDGEQKLVIDNAEERDRLVKAPPEEKITKVKMEEIDLPEDNIHDLKPVAGVRQEEESENMNLLCEEEIPGSPAPAMDALEPEEPTERVKEKLEKKIVILEMPFASAPTSGAQNSPGITVGACAVQALGHPPIARPIAQAPVQVAPVPVVQAVQNRRESNEAAPVMDNTPPTTPDSTISTGSGSPRGEEGLGGSPTSEDTKSREGEGEEARFREGVDEGPAEGEGKVGVAIKRPVEEPGSVKKRKRSRKSSEGKEKKRGRNRGSDSDDTSDGERGGGQGEGSNGVDSGRDQKGLKYNFFVDLDPELDGCQRIAILQQKLSELKKTYNIVKTELAAIERRRKKLRRREREAKKLSIAAMKAAKAEMQQACA